MSTEDKNDIREWIFSLKNQEDVRITGAQLKSAWLRTKEKLTLAEIANRIDADSGNVSKYLQKFEEKFQVLAKVIDELRGYRSLSPEELRLLGNKRKMERLQQGYYVAGTTPFGYVKERRLLAHDPRKSSVVKRLFLHFKEGKTIRKLSEETGLDCTQIVRILMNPVYKGIIRWRGREYPGKHEPLVSKELWDEVQALLNNRSRAGPAPYGTRWVSCHLEKDPKKALIVQQVFEARVLQRKTLKEIEKQFRISEGTIRHWLKNKVYVELGIVKPEIFDNVKRVSRLIASERRKKQKITTENRILNLLRFSTGLTRRELAEKLNLSRGYIQKCLCSLEKQGRVERIGYKKGERLWRFKEVFKV